MRAKARLFLSLALILIAFPPALQASISFSQKAIHLKALDKVTGRTADLKANIDQPVQFGTLTITARACFDKPPEEPPESIAYIEITEKKEAMTANIYHNWMFSSSPVVTPFDHPVYDVWVISCLKDEVSRKGSGETSTH